MKSLADMIQVDLAAAAIAVIALVLSVVNGRRQVRLEQETLRLQRDSDVIAWCNGCLAVLSRAEMMMRPPFAALAEESDYEKRRYELLAELSCCIDRGRFFFPNREADTVGVERELAFRGRRHPALDRLVWVYDALSKKVGHRMPVEPAERDQLRDQAIKWKREFISEVQLEVDPRRRMEFLHKHA